MAAPNWIAAGELIVAQNNPIFANTLGRPAQEIQENLLVEHDADGIHSARANGLHVECGSFTGNGTGGRTISLTNSNLTPKQVMCWQEEADGFSEVTNGGFDANTTGWTLSAGTLTHISSGGEDGGGYAQTAFTSNATYYFYQTMTGLTVGKTYFVREYVGKTAVAGVTSLTFGIGTSLGAGTQIYFNSGIITPWTVAEGTFVATAGTMIFWNKIIVSTGSTATFVFDSCFASQLEGNVADNRVTNGDFTTDLAGWTNNGFTATHFASGGASGGYCELTYASGTNTFSQEITGLAVGRKYVLGVYSKRTSGSGVLGLYIDDTINISPANTIILNVATWTIKVLTFTATSTSMQIWFENTSSTTFTIQIDEVVVVDFLESKIYEIWDTFGNTSIPGRNNPEFESNLLYDLAAGEFTVGLSSWINSNGLTNYYAVWGIDTGTTYTGDGGAAGSDPTWIATNVANTITADGTGSGGTGNRANNVAIEIWTEFTEEHNADGTHSVTIANNKIETGTYTGASGADNRVISMSDADFSIDSLVVFKDGSAVVSVSSDMTADNSKVETTAAFQADYIQDISTAGQFTVGTELNSGADVFYWLAIGT